MVSLLKQIKFECRVSSVLNKDFRNNGKMNMFDNDSDSCWNSDARSPQWISIKFIEECQVSAFEIEFQGGFVGKNCHLEAGSDSENMLFVQSFFPEDKNNVQRFDLIRKTTAQIFKLVFSESTDFFGRIIIYNLSFYS